MAASKAPKKKIKKVKKAAKKKTLDKAARKADPASIQDAAAAKARNPKAFVFSGRGKAKLQQARSAEKDQRRMHVPVVDTTPEEPPPYVIVVHGPPGVGKTTLIKNLLKHYTNQNIGDVKGPITVVSGKTRRLTFVECPQGLHGMIDAAKYADLVLLMVDGGFGFEMETFEFLNLLQVHGFPKVMGVLTHLDGFKDQKKLKKTKKALKHRFWAEIYQGAKLFYLSGMKNGKYMKREVLNLARFISVMKFRPLSWRMAHPYLLTDRLEDITPVEDIRQNPKCDREIAVYGYLRGTKLKGQARVHIAGVGDTTVEEVDGLVDPCPLPSMLKKRGLTEKERLLYAPMADVGGLLYDKDAVYIDIPDWKMQYSKTDGGVAPRYDEGEDMVRQLQANQTGVDDRLHQSQINLFSNQQPLSEGHFDAQNGLPHIDEKSDKVGSEDESGASSQSEEEEDSEEEDEEDTDEEDGGNPAGPSFKGLPSEETVPGSHRSRRRAVFSDEPVPATTDGSSDEEEEEIDDEEEERMQARLQSSSSAGSSGRDSDADSQDSEGLGRASHWKGNMQRHLAGLFSKRSANMQTYIYGTSALDTSRGKPAQQAAPARGGSDSDDDDDLFAPKKGQDEAHADHNADAVDAPDHSRVDLDDAVLAKWNEPGKTEQLRNRFVTGDWGAAGERDAARPGAEDEEDGDAFGEFEDLETGEKFGADGDQATATAMQAIKDAAGEEERQRVAEKASKKAAFNAEYDVGGGKGVKEKPGKGRKKSMQGEEEDEDAEETYYDAMKKDMTDRAARTKAAMDELDAEQRIAMEGYRPGTYLRLKFTGVPCELMQHFDPCQPLLVGGVAPSEEGVGFMQLRFKRHRWFPKILKTRDPLVFSIGWRRFQSVPVYAVEDSNGRHRMLKYTPEHMHCLATIHGALAPPNTGVLAIQTSTANAQSWRISATGVVLNLDASVRVMKKLKLKGTPFKVHKHTAFIGGMFNSQLEVSKFEGASIRTVSGIRGIVKKALRPGVQGSQDGSFRATFEDKPLMSDIVFLRAWIGVDLPRFYNPVTNLLGPAAKPLPRQLKPGHLAAEDPDAIALGATDANAVALPAARPTPQTPGGALPGPPFEAAATFTGPRPGRVFKTGMQGTGYYPDAELLDPALAPAPAALDTGAANTGGDEKGGWTGMRTVAQLRRELGVGAPRDSDSLYKPIERGPRKFNPLKIPKSLQAQLPFKSKVINFPRRKQETLEQKRAIKVREPGEKRADALVHALNAIRNAKIEKRLDQQSRRREERKKKLALEDAWKKQYNKEERKKRYRDQGKAEKFAEKRQRRD